MKVVKVVFITYIYSCVNSKSIIIYNVAETTFTTFILHLFHGLLFQWVEALLPKSGKVASIGWKGRFYLVKQAAITQMDTLLQGPFVSVIANSASAEPFFLKNELSVQFATFR